MKRLVFGLLIAVCLSLPLFAQEGLNVSFTIGAAKLEILKDALATRPNMMPLPTGVTPPVIDNPYVEQWVTRQCRQAIDSIIAQAERDEARVGGVFDVSALTKAERVQVAALIASFKK